MHHKPMTYLTRCYYGGEETYGKFAVYFCTKDGKRMIQTFDNVGQFKAFTSALDGLGFTKKRR